MDIVTARDLIEDLAADLNGMELWHMETERSRMGTYIPDPKNPGKHIWRPALKTGYGEATLEEVHRIFAEEVEIREGDVFYDLGSGLGKVVMMAALCFPVSRAVGIEQLTALDDGAQEILKRYQEKVLPTLPPDKQAQRIEFINDDMFGVNIKEDADVVFTNSTCFDNAMMFSLSVKLDQLREGTRVIILGQSLLPRKLLELKELPVKMPWGDSVVTLYEMPKREKVELPPGPQAAGNPEDA